MNPVQQIIQRRLDSLPPELRPLADASHRYLKYCSAIDVDETVLIAHQPWVALSRTHFAFKNGTVVGEWNNFTTFLADEVAASEEREYAQTPRDWWH